MLRAIWNNRRGRLFLLLGLAVLISQLQMFFFLFVVPLHVLYRKDGRKEFLLASLVVIAALMAAAFIELTGLEDTELFRLLMTLQLAVPTMFLVGVYMMLDGDFLRIRGIYRYLMAMVVIGTIGSFAFSQIFASETLHGVLQDMWTQMGMMFSSGSVVEGGMDDALFQSYFSSPNFWVEMQDLFMRTWLVGFSAMVLFCWQMGERISYIIALREGRTDVKPSLLLEDFRVPQTLLWPFLMVWAVVLASSIWPAPILRFPIWNAGLVLLLLYGVQGMGLIKHLADRFKLPRGMRFFGIFVLMALLMRPGLNIVLIIGIPALGLSEYWIHIRKQG